MQSLAVNLIDFYQRRLSPYKGYRCAHRVHHGGLSCSEFIKQAIESDGFAIAYPSIKRRFIECRQACVALQNEAQAPSEPKPVPPKKDDAATKHGVGCANVCTMPCL